MHQQQGGGQVRDAHNFERGIHRGSGGGREHRCLSPNRRPGGKGRGLCRAGMGDSVRPGKPGRFHVPRGNDLSRLPGGGQPRRHAGGMGAHPTRCSRRHYRHAYPNHTGFGSGAKALWDILGVALAPKARFD